VPDLPITVFRFFEKTMAKDPDERYQTAEEFIAALDRLDFSQQFQEAAPTAQVVSAQIGPIAMEDRGSHLSKTLGRVVRRAQRRSATPSPRQTAQAALRGGAGKRSGWKLWLLIGLGAAVLIGGAVAVAFLLAPKQTPTDGEPSAPQPSAPPAEGAAEAPTDGEPSAPQPAPPEPKEPSAVPPVLLEANARMQLDAAKAFEQSAGDEPFRRVAVLQAYQDVMDTYPGTKAAEEARQAMERLRKEEAEKAPAPSPAPAESEPPAE